MKTKMTKAKLGAGVWGAAMLIAVAGLGVGQAAAQTVSPDSSKSKKPAVEEVVGNGDGNTYYWIKLKGNLGREICETPLRQQVADAREHKADVIVIEIENRWNSNVDAEVADYVLAGRGVDEAMFRVEPITTVITNEIPKEWTVQPRVVMWIKQALGGIAPLAFAAKEVYFHPGARIGALGGLERMFDGTGDEVVREKQRSLRLGHLEGILRAGGYDPNIMRAMTRKEFVLTLGYDSDGKAVLLERRPENSAEELLSDSGAGAEQDSLDQVMSGEGNDYLTLNSRTASLIGLSRGEAVTEDQLLQALGLDRSGRQIKSKSSKIPEDWVRNIDRAERALLKAAEGFRDVQVQAPGGWNERRAARSKQKKFLQEMKSIQNKWGEGLTQQFLGQNQIPPIQQIDDLINQIDTAQLMDKKDK